MCLDELVSSNSSLKYVMFTREQNHMACFLKVGFKNTKLEQRHF